ncbi:MAG: Stk1 family PASTA domain-containing Ser/Thr kinase [Blautia sp.]|nr:Stk1 family PASTA domain-containing Ser/Thr kinase [Blautia sp.]
MLKIGMFIAERYEITAKIGTGGMADVYKAMDHKLNRYVAVKVLKQEFRTDATFVKKFRSEAQAAAGLAHPNIVSVYDVGDDDGIYYIVMELIEGITLKEYISKKGKLSVKEATSIAIQVCMGLEAAHKHGIVHRDVKPQNIIISTDGKVKVTDFGIARAASSNTISSNVMGSVHYSSPEQVRGGYSDEKSDIYSLGITLYEMVTGRVPFDGDTTVSIAIKHLQEEMTPPTTYTPDLPHSLEQIIYKCTQKSVNRRYEKMEDIIEDLKHSLIDPSGDFVKLNTVNNAAKTVVFSDKELGQIKKTSKTSGSGSEKTKQIDDKDVKRTVLDKKKAERQKQQRKKSAKDRNGKSKEPVIDLGFIIPMLALMAGIALLLGVIWIVGRSAGLIGTGANAQATPTPAVSGQVQADNRVEVPSIVGYSEEEARALLENSQLGLQNVGEEPSMYERGLICRQEISAGMKVDPYTTVRYYISSGTADVTIPAVDYYTGIEAEQVLQNAGLRVDVRRIYVDSDYDGYPVVDPGYVIRTEPSGGQIAKAGDTVTLYVSRGLDYGDSAELPDVVGMTQSEAMTVLGKFMNIQIVEQQNQDIAQGEVISQSPGAYSYVDPDNGVVVLTVSSGSSLPQTEISDEDAVQTSIVSEAVNAGEVWKCNQRLNTPTGYGGGSVRLQLLQIVGGQPQTSLVADGEALSFPYQLDLTGVPGVAEGTLYLYEMIDGKYQELGIYTLTFTRVE